MQEKSSEFVPTLNLFFFDADYISISVLNQRKTPARVASKPNLLQNFLKWNNLPAMAKKKKQPKTKKDGLWIEAKRRCRLNNEDIRVAREMGLNPRSLIKNIQSKSQPWKSPVKVWIQEMYEKRQEKAATKKARKEQAAAAHPVRGANQREKKC